MSGNPGLIFILPRQKRRFSHDLDVEYLEHDTLMRQHDEGETSLIQGIPG